MSALALDLRGPVVAIVGDFNPAIFSMNWVATHLFGVPEGAEMEVLEAVAQVDASAFLRLSFLDGVALSVSPSRIDFHAVNGDQATFTKVETVVDKILETLPHTPIRALGVNFRWMDEDPSGVVVDLFDTPEGLEGRFEVTMRQTSAQIQLEDAALNLGRVSSNTEVQFTFNYHSAVTSAEECRPLLPGIIARNLAHSTGLMRTLYKYDEHTVLEYAPNQKQGELADAT